MYGSSVNICCAASHHSPRAKSSLDGTSANTTGSQVNVPKTRRTYCKGKDCKKHTNHKVTQYKAGKVHHNHNANL